MNRALHPFAAAAAAGLANGGAIAAEIESTEQGPVRVETVAQGLDHPWGFEFLPDGGLLVTERSGALRLVSAQGLVSDPVVGVPEVDARGQGGLLDVALHPDFARNRLVYLSYSERGEGGNSTAVVRGVLSPDGRSLAEVERIFTQQPKLPSTKHFGSRLVFDGKGHLFVTLGERSSAEFREQAQDLDSHLGKIVRLAEDGSVPEDNPFAETAGALPEIWSYGHRNIQAAAINPETGQIWEIEHGPKGGDEINIAEPGKNYGWPVVSHGVNYDGSPVGTGRRQAPGMEDPLYTWTPVIAPSGMAFYMGGAFPAWHGDLFVGGLATTALVRLELEGAKIAHEERLLEELGARIRDVAVGPEGALYLLTDEDDGKVLRLTPAAEQASGG